MKKILFLGLAFSLFACKNNDAESDASTNQDIEAAVQTTSEDLVDSTATPDTRTAAEISEANKNSIMYSNSNPNYTTQTTNTTQTTAPPVSVAKGMNPSHGQPGHRCDIAVGAPLNSKAATTTTTPNTTTISSTGQTGTVISNGAKITTTNNNAPTVTAEGMNPPHGQDGHRCDLAVGAPLNSAAVPTVANEVKE
jgi:uncharacterized membrane protein